ncbi:hypothetical protein DNTS_035152, partial [Danionella cerebrum]
MEQTGTVNGAGMCNMDRVILNEIKLEEVDQRRSEALRSTVLQRIRDSLRCSVGQWKIWIFSCIPVLSWIPQYSLRENGLGDLASGVSVGIMHLPGGMAYALLASVPSVFGLYTSFYPVLVYFIFGTSRHISIGTFAVISIMIGSVSERLSPDDHFLTNGTNGSFIVDTEARDVARVKVAAATTLLCVTYLSEPLVRGYTTAAAVHVITAQLKYMFGVSPRRFNGALQLLYTLIELAGLLPQTHIPTLVISLVSLSVLVIVKEVNKCHSHRLPLPVPIELLVIIAGTLASYYTSMKDVNGIDVVGEIPRYAISISLGKTFALKHGYKVDSNQELVALGLSNLIGGFFQCFCVTSSLSRSLIQESTGGKTQLVWLVTFLCTLLLNLDLGLAVSILFTLLTVIFRTQNPRYSVLGRVPNTELYLETDTYKEAKAIPGIFIFRSSATIYFANAELYEEALFEKSGINITTLLKINREKENEEQVGVLREFINRILVSMKSVHCHERDHEHIIDDSGIATVTFGNQNHAFQEEQYVVEQDPAPRDVGDQYTHFSRCGSKHKHPSRCNTHSIILDFSPVSFIDTVTLKTLKNIYQDFSKVDVNVYIAGCQVCVVQQLERGGFFSESFSKKQLFPSIHDAVLHCLSTSGPDVTISGSALLNDADEHLRNTGEDLNTE